jgi:hypothetical protein
MVRFDHPRQPLPGYVPPGGRASLWLPVLVPDAPGDYRVVVDLVYEGQTWWAERGARTASTLLRAIS